MKLFTCTACGNLIYFNNVCCTQCGATLGFLQDTQRLSAIVPAGDGLWQPVGDTRLYRMCNNYTGAGVCNWMLEAESEQHFCRACDLNQTIPDLSVPGNTELWRIMETEKRRLVYSLLQLNLPLMSLKHHYRGMAFEFLADPHPSFSERSNVITGHNRGLITLNIAEADPAKREQMREQMDEPYRTILGHFRHESGHYYWDRLVKDSQWLHPFRHLFGDDTLNYTQALDRHYRFGAPADWPSRFVSAYASSHPWEDWAETWAHYLHIVDTLETAYEYGLQIHPRVGSQHSMKVSHDFNPYHEGAFDTLIEHWLPLTFVMNSLNRSIGHDHAYPFVLAPATIEKLRFVHRVVHGCNLTAVPE
ncbi:zinc-binding metallopeptidase family protein [Nitrincola iocasae]|uniref:Zinc-ribbon domain-containing protein n=1 Tax=Nitrincola iocasae TaxID=2614693 RepID=A0A5J6LFN4_9GAMM|nr:putative zinc-binding peptidase [Nitrincola iocasae]QEW07440.1 hypothetical protein F5I99_13580 [Nitrincola iocasae]